jgi:hypothetical protein
MLHVARRSSCVGYRTEAMLMDELKGGQFVPRKAWQKSLNFRDIVQVVSARLTLRVENRDDCPRPISDKYFSRDA